MIMARSPSGNRDIALTTLVDLLVQVIFVLVLILIGSNILDAEPGIPTIGVPLEPWKTLISISEIDPRVPVSRQADLLTEKVRELNRLLSEAKKALELCEARSKVCNEENKRLKDLLGGVGRPSCKDDKKNNEFVLKVFIDEDGGVSAVPIGAGIALTASLPIPNSATAKRISRDEFLRHFALWREHGVKRDCSYYAEVSYSEIGNRRSYEQTRAAIARYFRTQIVQQSK